MIKHLLSILFLQFITVGLFSQGTLRGTIIDSNSGETVPFANILVQETGTGTTSDLDGTYSLSLEAGTYQLEFSFIGYASLTVSDIIVVDGEVEILDVTMTEETELLEEVVVTAKQIKNTEAAVLTIQKKSINLLDGISSQSFRKIGDSDAAGAIKRVTGVSVEGGKYVFVRGLGDRYTKTILNGMDIPGLDPDRNTLQMDIFPTNLIDNILILKTFTPDLPGDFTGGVVNIVTKDFPDHKTLNLSGGIGFNPSMHLQSNYLKPQSSGTDLFGFDNGLRDLPFYKFTQIPTPGQRNAETTRLTQAFDNNWRGERATSTPDFNLGLSGGNQFQILGATVGYNFALNYKTETQYFDDVSYNLFLKPNANEDFELDPNRVQTGEQSSRNVLLTGLVGLAVKIKNHKVTFSGLRINNGTSKAGFFNRESFISGVSVIQRDNLDYTERSITNGIVNGKHSFGEGLFEVDWKVSSTLSQINDKDVRVAPFRVEGNTFSIEPSEGAVPQRLFRNLEELNLSGRLDLTYNIGSGQKSSKIKVGGSYVTKNRDYEILAYTFDIRNSDDITFSGDPNEILLPTNVWTPETRTGVFAIGTPQPSNTFDATQNIMGVYGMGEFSISDHLKAVGGVRTENFVHRYTGQNNQESLVFDDEELLNKWNILPSLNLIYALNENTNVRGSFSQTIANPSFKELSLAQIYDPLSDRTFIGNLDLVQSSISNYDLRYETFSSGGQMFAISGFYKSFTDPIEIVAFSDAAPEDVTPRNVGDATIVGAEFEIRRNLGFINENMSKFSIGSNVTIVQSSVQMDRSENGEFESRQRAARQGEIVEDTRQMQGQSPFIINTYLNYSDIERGLEANLSYNVQGKRLAIVGISANPDVYENPFHNLSFKLSKKLGKEQNSRISIGAKNLLSSKRVRQYESFNADPQVYDNFAPGMSFSVGYSLSF